MYSDERAKILESVRGVSLAKTTSRGLSFSRLPEHTYQQHSHAPIVAKMAERLSGARIEILTSATEVKLTYRSMRDSNPTTNWIAGPAVISLTTPFEELSIAHENGDLRVWNGDQVVEIIEGETSEAIFELAKSVEPRLVQLWLPHNCSIEVINIECNADWWPAPELGKPLWVHYGSSISHCEDAATPLGVWPVAAARALQLDLYNLGLGGCANLEQFAARTIRDLPADLISLKVGINVVNGANLTERTFGPAVHGFLDTIRDRQPNTPILVISPVCCPAHENNPGPSETGADGKVMGQPFSRHTWIGELTLTGIRSILKEIVAQRAKTDPKLYYLNGLELFNDVEALTMPDGLHPDADGYKVIAQNFVERHPSQWLNSARR